MPGYQLNMDSVIRKALGLVLVFIAGMAHGQTSSAESDMLETTRHWLDQAVSSVRSSGSSALKMEVILGTLDSRLRLAPCNRVEPFLPPGSRLWGRTRMGLRCADGAARWSVFLPVTVKAYGLAWVIKGNMAAGSVLTPDDVMEAGTGISSWCTGSRCSTRSWFPDHVRWTGAFCWCCRATRTSQNGQRTDHDWRGTGYPNSQNRNLGICK